MEERNAEHSMNCTARQLGTIQDYSPMGLAMKIPMHLYTWDVSKGSFQVTMPPILSHLCHSGRGKRRIHD